MRGEQLEALERYDEAFALLGEVRPRDNFVLRRYFGAITNRAMIVAEMGRLDEAAIELDRLVTIAADAGDLSYQCIAHFCRTRLATYRGDPRAALDRAREALEVAERMGLAGFRPAPGSRSAERTCSPGAPRRRWPLSRTPSAPPPPTLSRRASASRCSPALPTLTSRWATWNARSPSPLRERQRRAARSVSGAADAFSPALGRCAPPAPAKYAAEIVRLLDSAEAVARHCAARIYEPLILEERARLARACGEEDEAQSNLRDALRLYWEMGAHGHGRRLDKEFGDDAGAARVA